MAMTEREATSLVETLRRGYPTYPLDDIAVGLYVQSLVRCPFDVAVGASAVHGWIVNEPWMPKVSELLDVIEVEAASRNQTRTRALGPGDVRPATREQRSTIAEVLATVQQEMPRPAHPDDEWLAQFDARCRELLAAQGVTIDDEAETFVCTRCRDTGFETEVVDGKNVATPCPCDPARYDRWRGGHFEPNHSCAECTALVKGKR